MHLLQAHWIVRPGIHLIVIRWSFIKTLMSNFIALAMQLAVIKPGWHAYVLSG
jgi:hypothetical protein